ncbi:hydroxyacylglutathione hydrolase C-terminal domain-containing protein, partial [Glaesserella parasuis]
MEHQERADILRSQHKPTLPSTIGVEKQINPFMQAVTLDEFIILRQKKDNF